MIKDMKLMEIKSQIKFYLSKTDYIQLPDSEKIESDDNVRTFSQQEKKEYREYRKYLRRIPQLFKRQQILELEVMSFEEWKLNKPTY